MKKIILLLSVLWFIPLPSKAAEPPRYTRLEIIYTNDLFGRLFPFYGKDGEYIGGAAKRAALVREIRVKSEYPVLLLDAGNIFTWGPLEGQLGVPDIAVMNAMGYDAGTIGERDFAGSGVKYDLFPGARNAKFPLVCANLKWESTGELVLPPYTILRAGDLKVAVFGLTFIGTTGMRAEDPLQTAKELTRKLKKEADLIVALAHIGYTSATDLAKAVPDIDVIVCGSGQRGTHETTLLETPEVISSSLSTDPFWVGGPILVEEGRFGINLGRLELNLHRRSDQRYRVMSCNGYLQPVKGDTPPAEDITAILAKAAGPLGKPIGRCSRDLIPKADRGDDVEKWIAEVMRREGKADVGAHTFDANTGIRKGAITQLDVRMVLPYSNILAIVELTPNQYQEMLKVKGLTVVGTPPSDAEKITVATDDYWAGRLKEQGGVIRSTGKRIDALLMNYISNVPSIGEELNQPKQP